MLIEKEVKKVKHINRLNVFNNNCLVGEIILNNKGLFFTYDQSWLKNKFNISPLDLKMNASPQKATDLKLFNNLHGVFANSISDGWGLMIIDKAIQQKFNWTKNSITQLDRLFFIGDRGMGGLSYKPSDKENKEIKNLNLIRLFEENNKIIKGSQDEIISELYLSLGSPGGARPKAIFAKNKNSFLTGYSDIPKNYEPWIIKFFSKEDSLSNGKIEFIYSLLAKECGLEITDTELIKTKIEKIDHYFFATKRFDRHNNQKIHTISSSALLYASHRVPSLSYTDLFKLTAYLNKNNNELEKIFNLMLFNIIFNNQDDHSKNFSYIYLDDVWHLSPAYDLTFVNNASGEHMTDLYGSGKPTINEVEKIAKEFNIKNYKEKIERFLAVSLTWPEHAKKSEIPINEINEIEKKLEEIRMKFKIPNNLKNKNFGKKT